MAIELANAYVTLVPSLRGATKTIQSELGGIDTGKAGTSIGAKLSSGIGKALKVGAAATGAAVATTIGASLVKGFGRLRAIDEAEGKLRGLGHSAETVEAVMTNALASVQGTAFGLDEAATTAAGAMAAGIKPGKDLERNLKLVADAATIAGTDMGSMGAIFNKVAASNKVQMDVINQLHDAGVPALALLADQMGVTAEEASKMASAGEVDFATFQAAMESGLGGAALESSNTFTGAMKNVGAALGRLGAAFLGPAFQQGTTIFAALTATLDGLAPVAAKAGDAFGNLVIEITGGFRAMAAAFQDGGNDITSSGLAGVLEGIGVIARDIGDEVSGGLRAMGAAFRDGGDDITSSGLAGVLETIGVIARNLADSFSTLGPELSEIVQGFSPVSLAVQAIQPVLPLAVEAFRLLGDVLAQMVPPLAEVAVIFANAVVPIVTQLATALLPPLLSILGSVAPVFSEIAAAIVPVVSVLASALIPLVEFLLPIVSTVFGAVADIVSGVMKAVGGVIKTVTAVIQGDWKGAWEGIKQLFQGVWDAIKGIVNGAVNVVASVIGGVVAGIASKWNSVWSSVRSFFSNVWNSIVQSAANFGRSVRDKFTDVVGFVQSVPDRILGFFSGIGGWLRDSGRALIQGFLDGIASGFNAAKDFVSDGLGAIRNLFPFSPAKDGPFSGRGWVSYSGASLGATFTESVAESLRRGRGEVVGELGAIQGSFDRFDTDSAFRLRTAAPYSSDRDSGSRRLTLVVGGREFDAYVREEAGVVVDEYDAARARVLRGGRQVR